MKNSCGFRNNARELQKIMAGAKGATQRRRLKGLF
jgi:hypothetical protein